MDSYKVRELIRESLTLMSLDPEMDSLKSDPKHHEMIEKATATIFEVNDVERWDQLTSARLYGYLLSNFTTLGLIKQGLENEPFELMTSKIVRLLLMGEILSFHAVADELVRRGDL